MTIENIYIEYYCYMHTYYEFYLNIKYFIKALDLAQWRKPEYNFFIFSF